MEGQRETAAPIRVLIVDDDRLIRQLVRRHLVSDGLEVVGEMDDITGVLERVGELRPNVVLMDYLLPSGTGDEATAEITDAFPDVRVLAMTASEISESVTSMIRAGARGFVLKHRDALRSLPNDVRRIHEGQIVLADRAAADVVGELTRLEREWRDTSARLQLAYEALRVQFDQLKESYRTTVQALSSAVEARDEYTGGHILRVSDYSVALATVVDPSLTVEEFVFGYLLHDIGKLRIPDEILRKPERLTEEEYETIKTHTTVGVELIESIRFLHHLVPLVRNHHERWDGRGYPDRLAAEDIPLIARIFAVADALDAMTTDRPYRAALPLEFALVEFRTCAGSQFDPAVVRVFSEIVDTDPAFDLLRRGVVPGRVES